MWRIGYCCKILFGRLVCRMRKYHKQDVVVRKDNTLVIFCPTCLLIHSGGKR